MSSMASGLIADRYAADGRGRHAIEPIDPVRQPDPQAWSRVGDDLAEPAHDGALLRPDLRHAGEQVRGERDEQEIAETFHALGCVVVR